MTFITYPAPYDMSPWIKSISDVAMPIFPSNENLPDMGRMIVAHPDVEAMFPEVIIQDQRLALSDARRFLDSVAKSLIEGKDPVRIATSCQEFAKLL